jgi:2-acylglycerol O-acyltransferase 2
VHDKLLYLFAPHGVFPFALTLMSGLEKEIGIVSEKNPHIRVAIASNMFHIPLLGPLLGWLGCIGATDPEMSSAITTGCPCACVPDGIAGAFHSSRNREVLHLRNRAGLFQLINDRKVTVVPVYCFGHTQAFELWAPWDWLKDLSRYFKFAFIFFRGRSFVAPLPLPHPMSVVFGTPIPPNSNMQEEIVRSFGRIYNEFKEVARDWDKNKKLEILIYP